MEGKSVVGTCASATNPPVHVTIPRHESGRSTSTSAAGSYSSITALSSTSLPTSSGGEQRPWPSDRECSRPSLPSGLSPIAPVRPPSQPVPPRPPPPPDSASISAATPAARRRHVRPTAAPAVASQRRPPKELQQMTRRPCPKLHRSSSRKATRKWAEGRGHAPLRAQVRWWISSQGCPPYLAHSIWTTTVSHPAPTSSTSWLISFSPDLTTSAFFSLHRPLSLATTIPPPSTTEAFDSIFVSRPQRDPWENGNSAERRPEDVVYALSNLFDNLDTSASESQDDGMRWQVISESSSHDGVKHLDGPPRMKSLDDMVAHFKPFHAPPPPQPFTNEQKPAEKKRAAKQPRQKRYATTIYLTESTGLNGQTTFTASTSPIVRIPGPEEQSAFEEPAADGSRARTFRERARNARRAYFLCQQESLAAKPSVRAPVRRAPSAARKERMMLISVKRQRKLKMKKHKYKKLMKRTRNLRRRQDRA